MLRRCCWLLLLLSLLSVVEAGEPPRVLLTGDSTVSSRSGWGDSFGRLLADGTQWVNLARSGRSSKSYRDEGWWDKVLAERPTWILIQFGHNDQPGKGPERETDPQSTYRENLIRYLNDAREVGATPVLITPLTRRIFDAAGNIDAASPEPLTIPAGFRLSDYAAATRAVAMELQVPLVDLNALSVRQMNRWGRDAASRFDPKPDDTTHLNSYAAALTAELVADEMSRVAQEFVPLLRQRRYWQFDFSGTGEGTFVSPQTSYEAERGYGFLPGQQSASANPLNFAVRLPEGNYEVIVRLGHPERATVTTIKAEARRLILENIRSEAGQFVTRSFVVNVRQPQISTDQTTKLNSRELGPPLHPDWDALLTLEFNGRQPGVSALSIRRTSDATTVFVAGDSTVTDQRQEPYAGWGQMLPRFFGPEVAVSNQAESGLALRSFEYQLRLQKVLSMMQPGDYLLIQFGHNDQKDNREGAGPFTTYKQKLTEFVRATRERHGIPILVTSMERLRMDSNGQQTPTLSDYAAAVREVGEEEQVAVIDLHAMSLELYAGLGPERCTKAFVFYPAGTFPGIAEQLKDRTHHNSYGAYELARCVVQGLREQVPELSRHLAGDVSDFDPGQPDDPDTFEIPASPVVVPPNTPAGN